MAEPERGEPGAKVVERPDAETALPRLYRVLLHNDDYTTMEFVVMVLVSIFHHPEPAAVRIMLHVHQKGLGICGAYPHEIAETKVDQVHERARERGFPLRASVEEG